MKRSGVKKSVEYIKEQRETLNIEQEYEELHEEVERLEKKKPSSDEQNSNEFITYKKDCMTLNEKISKYARHQFIAAKARRDSKRLKELMKWVDGKIGDGSWKAIEKCRDRYAEKPSEGSYKALKTAVESFDGSKEGNGSYESKVKELSDAIDKDWKEANEVDEAWKVFCTNKNYTSFAAFESAYDRAKFEYDTVIKTGANSRTEKWRTARVDLILRKYTAVAHDNRRILRPSEVSLEKVKIGGSSFSNRGRPNRVYIWCSTKSLCTNPAAGFDGKFFYAEDMPDDWTLDQECGKKESTPSHKNDIPIFFDKGITLGLTTYPIFPPFKIEGRMDISFYEILVGGALNRGKFEKEIEIWPEQEGQERSRPAKLTFKFSGLPTLKEEEF